MTLTTTRPQTNEERLTAHRARQRPHVLILEYEFEGQQQFTCGMSVEDCVQRADQNCESKMWIFENIQTHDEFFKEFK